MPTEQITYCHWHLSYRPLAVHDSRFTNITFLRTRRVKLAIEVGPATRFFRLPREFPLAQRLRNSQVTAAKSKNNLCLLGMKGRKAMGWVIAGSVICTAMLVIVVLNFVPPEKKLTRQLVHDHGIAHPQFKRELSSLLGPTILHGNRIENLHNGREIFPAMLSAIATATRSITFETYIYWSGDIGRTFANVLAQRAQAGVRVHVLLDWVGSVKMDVALLALMKDAGVEVERYHPLQWYHMARMNNRTHRKVLVVDGRVGFTGGVGIAEQWSGDAEDPEHWRDEHFRFEGPVVAQAQAVFMDNWIKVTGVVLRGDAYFPALAPVANVDAQMFSSSPSGGSESMALLYLMAITAAERSIDLSAAYFIPDHLTQPALLAASQRGVVVRIIVPGKYMDADSVRMASRAQWEPLLQAGALIHEFVPTMFHCKILIVDSLLVSVGSTNFDNRSFSLNDEASLNLIDSEFAKKMTATFENDLSRSKLITLAAWRKRPTSEKLRELMVRPWSSQL